MLVLTTLKKHLNLQVGEQKNFINPLVLSFVLRLLTFPGARQSCCCVNAQSHPGYHYLVPV